MRSGTQEKSDVAIKAEIAKPANAYQAYQLARYHFHRVSLEDVMKSRAWLEEAVRMDNKFSPAYVALAEQTIMEAITGLHAPVDSFPKAREALSRAADVQLDSAEFYAVAGFVSLIADWNFSDAETKLRKALRLNPHHTFARKYLGEVLMFQGRSKEAETYLRRALEIEPMSLHVGIILTLSCFLGRNYEKLIQESERLLAMFPRFAMAEVYRCLAWEQLGRANEAVAAYERILSEPDGEIARRFMGYSYALSGDQEKARQTLAKLEAEGHQHYLSPTYLANIYAGLNEKTTALSCLEKALSERDPWLLWMGTDPRLDNLRRESRFNELLREVGLGRLAQVYVTQSARRAVVMPAERWDQIDRLFHETLALPPADRAQFLATECAGDEALRREIESLLSSLDEAGDFIETPAGDLAADLLGTHRSAYEPGQQIGSYRLIRHLGSGGMGEVYLAEDIRLNRKVALKLLPPYFTVNPDRVRRFEREARAASALSHPNIVTIYEIGHSNTTHFIATEFVDGKTLRQLINEKPLTLNEILNVSIQVADALSGAHAAGIVHRDIKPENIMIRRDGYVKILDFGLAKLTEQQTVEADLETPTLLQSNPGLVMGTVQYMSPEQARAKNVGIGTDIWSLGIVMYELLAGHVPFTGETPSHVMVALMENELPSVSNYVNASPELDSIVKKALCKQPKERYQSARALAKDLKQIKRQLRVVEHLRRFADPVEAIGGTSSPEPTLARATAASLTPEGMQSLPHVSSAEYLIREINRHKVGVALAGILLVTITVVGAYFSFAKKPTIRSIAVLPFNNAGNNPDMEYLSDGLSESLTNNLSPVPGLTVISRYSSFKYKGKALDPSDVAKNLGVDAFITGRIAQTGDDYLISVELVDARNGSQIWGKQYNRKSSDVLMVLAEGSREITQELRLRLTLAEEKQLVRTGAVKPQAYDLYLKGRALWEKDGTDNLLKAIEYYQQAIAVDPAYALAHAELSRSYSNLITDNVLKPEEFSLKAETAALKALELDENLPEAHMAVARVKMDAWDWATAEREIKRALELNPNLVWGHQLYGWYFIVHGRREEAVAELNRAWDLDPLSTSSYQRRFVALTIFRQNDQALEVAKKLLEINPSKPGAQVCLGQIYSRVGRYREAIAAYQEALKLGDKTPDLQFLLACAYAKSGGRDQAREILERYESGKEHMTPFGLAGIHVALGELDQAFAALEAAYAQHDQQLIYLLGEWEFDTLHDDPRFQDLARRVGLL